MDNMWHPIELVITGLSGACLCPTFDKMKITFFSISVFKKIIKPGKLVNCQLLAYVCRVMKNGRYPVAQFMQRKGEKMMNGNAAFGLYRLLVIVSRSIVSGAVWMVCERVVGWPA